jgi:hypothetical protein
MALASEAWGEFLEGLVKSGTMILISEIGDKTFFIAAIMAMRHPRSTVRPVAPPRSDLPPHQLCLFIHCNLRVVQKLRSFWHCPFVLHRHLL